MSREEPGVMDHTEKNSWVKLGQEVMLASAVLDFWHSLVLAA
jgi:hypothetical protein